MRHHGGGIGRRGADSADDVAAGARAAGPGNDLVAADVIAVHVSVHHVADRLARDLADLGEQLPGHARELRVHHEHAFVAGLHGHVAARADEHVDVALHVLDVHLDVREIGLLRGGAPADRGQRASGERRGDDCGGRRLQLVNAACKLPTL